MMKIEQKLNKLGMLKQLLIANKRMRIYSADSIAANHMLVAEWSRK